MNISILQRSIYIIIYGKVELFMYHSDILQNTLNNLPFPMPGVDFILNLFYL